MSTLSFHAQPFDMDAAGFFFSTEEEMKEKASQLVNSYGEKVEEFEIALIDGSDDAAFDFAKHAGPCFNNIGVILEATDDMADYELAQVAFLLYEGYKLDYALQNFDSVSMRQADSRVKLAEEMLDDGEFGEIPPHLEYYIDCEALARDKLIDLTEFDFAGERYYCEAR